MNLESSIVVALVTLVGTVVINLLQRKKLTSESKKSEMETAEILIARAMDMSKQEIEVLRIVNEALRLEVTEKTCEVSELKKQLDAAEAQVIRYKKRLKEE